jgi:hypothetical protein
MLTINNTFANPIATTRVIAQNKLTVHQMTLGSMTPRRQSSRIFFIVNTTPPHKELGITATLWVLQSRYFGD